jgi:hypothetical protein
MKRCSGQFFSAIKNYCANFSSSAIPVDRVSKGVYSPLLKILMGMQRYEVSFGISPAHNTLACGAWYFVGAGSSLGRAGCGS